MVWGLCFGKVGVVISVWPCIAGNRRMGPLCLLTPPVSFFVVEFYPFFSPVSWYPIVFSSYYLVSSLQPPYRLGRDEG